MVYPVKDNWWVWAGVAFAAYLVFKNSSTILTSATTAYLPTANAAGNEFSCPSGTVYVDSGEQASGGGICE
jgi:hypothetical protein